MSFIPPAIHYEPLRPNRCLGVADKYEFTHGTDSVCIYDINSLDFVKEIPVGTLPDCHATSCDNRYLYIACETGLYCINQQTLEMEKHVTEVGHVYATNVLLDGSTMLLHDAYGGVFIMKDIQDMAKIRIHKRIVPLSRNEKMYTLGGKGNLIGNGRYYICNAWRERALFSIDLEDDYSFRRLIDYEPLYDMGDDLTVSADKTRAYSACYADRAHGYVAVTDLAALKVVKTIPALSGTCGLTMSCDERYVIASNDGSNAITIIDTLTDSLFAHISCDEGFKQLGITGYIQGISVGAGDEIYVYGCSGNGALACFYDLYGGCPKWVISYPGGKVSGTAA